MKINEDKKKKKKGEKIWYINFKTVATKTRNQK